MQLTLLARVLSPTQLVGLGIDDPACAAVHAPLALLPVPYPRQTFEQVGTPAQGGCSTGSAARTNLRNHRHRIGSSPLAAFLLPQAKQAALAFNTMIDAVAADEAYLQEVLAAAAQEDEFTVRRGGGWWMTGCVLQCRLLLGSPAQAGGPAGQ